jgi:heptose I phosphotransferase
MSGESLWRRLTQGARRLWQRPDWARFAGDDWAERIMDMAVTDHFHAKQGRSTGRLVLEARGQRLTVYLKRHYRLSRWRGLLTVLWPDGGWSPALEEGRHLEWAREQGLPVPAAVAAGEYLGPWGRLQSFLAVEELTGMVTLHEAVPAAREHLDLKAFRLWKRGLVVELARLARMLHDRRCFHKDLYLCHFFIPAGDTASLPQWKGRVHMIDLHRLARHRWSWPVWLVKDLAQLLYSSEVAGVGPRDRLSFWRAYLGAARRTRPARWLRRWIVWKWRRYRTHNARTLVRRALAKEREEMAA